MRWLVVIGGVLGCGGVSSARHEPIATAQALPAPPPTPVVDQPAASQQSAPAATVEPDADAPRVLLYDHGSGRSSASFPDAPVATPTQPAAPLTAEAPSSPSPATSSTQQSSGVSNAARVVGAMRTDFRACYQAALVEQPTLEGSVRVTIRVAADGSVASASGAPASLPPVIVECVLRRARQAKFDPPEGGSAVIAVPVTFVRDTSKH